MCRTHLVKVQSKKAKMDELGAQVVFVAHDTPEKLEAGLLEGLDLLYPVAFDPERSSYGDWGLTRASLLELFLDANVWKTHARAIFKEKEKMRAFGQDPLQLGGDFIIDREGRVAWALPQVNASRPPAGLLLKEIERVARAGRG